jgi:phenylacetate-coenzyme A ligase PaaK-like adenylate-forming protein
MNTNLVSNPKKMPQLRRSSWAWLLKNFFLPAGDLAFGQKMMKRLSFLEEAQWWQRERLHSFRDQCLRDLIQVAYAEVPYYRELMDQAKLKPSDIQKASDLRKLPISTKQMLRSAYPDRVTRNTGRKTYESRTSGSTGANFIVAEDSETAGWYRASFLLALEWAGWKIGEPHLQTGMTLNRDLPRRMKDALLSCHYVSAYDLTDSHLDVGLDILERYSIRHLWGYPGSLYYLARRAAQRGWNRPLTTIVTWGDNLYPHYRKTIEDAFKTRVTDTYGCAEGIQIAAQCGEGSTYHTHTLDVIVEYVDDQGEPVSSSQPGNLILTRLYPGPMPLVRYKVGDIGVAGEEPFCKCGRGYETLKGVQGRDTDVVVTPSGNRLIVHFFTGLLESFKEIDSFQVVQENPGAIQLRIKPAGEFSNETRRNVIQILTEMGADLNIEIELVDEIPITSSGKRRFVISRLARS